MGKFMDKLPTVISCCFCCFLRAGTVLIAISSFIVGVTFAPNVTTPGLLKVEGESLYTEDVIQSILGAVSIGLCFLSFMLLIGALCSIPILIEIYQWGIIVYCGIVSILFAILASLCLFAHSNCLVTAVVLACLMIFGVLLTAYFVIVVNSLRMSILLFSSLESNPV